MPICRWSLVSLVCVALEPSALCILIMSCGLHVHLHPVVMCDYHSQPCVCLCMLFAQESLVKNPKLV